MCIITGGEIVTSSASVGISDTRLAREIASAFTYAATVEIFKAGYDHYLPRQFIEQYAYGNGKSINLSPSDMAELGVMIDLNSSNEFNALVNQLVESGGGTAIVSFSNRETASTHGTLGVFTANYKGELTVSTTQSGSLIGWSFDGVVNFSDTWDFDPKPWGVRQSEYAEVLTRIGNIFLPGNSFDITSYNTPLSQTNLQTEAFWVGTGVLGQPSNFAIEINR